MKEVARRVVLVVLVLAELWLLTGFLPQNWQQKMYAGIEKRWPSQVHDYSRITHPALEYELQPFKPIGIALLTGLVIINGWIIVALLRPSGMPIKVNDRHSFQHALEIFMRFWYHLSQ